MEIDCCNYFEIGLRVVTTLPIRTKSPRSIDPSSVPAGKPRSDLKQRFFWQKKKNNSIVAEPQPVSNGIRPISSA